MIPDLQFSSFFFIQMPNIDKDPNWRVETFISFVFVTFTRKYRIFCASEQLM